MGRGQHDKTCLCGRTYTYENFMARRAPVLMPTTVQNTVTGEYREIAPDVHTVACWKKGRLVPYGWKVIRYA